MIEFKSTCLHFGTHKAIDQLNVTLPARSFTVIRGASGAGKSSLLRLLATFEAPTAGDLWVGGSSIAKLSRRARAQYRRSVGYTGGDVDLLPVRTCFENVALPLRIAGVPDKEVQARVPAALNRVGLLNVSDMHPDELSGGEQQRLQIARAVVNRPALLLADEPTAQLDDEAAQVIANLFHEFNKAGVTVVVATHAPEHFPMATHQLFLNQGHMERFNVAGHEGDRS